MLAIRLKCRNLKVYQNVTDEPEIKKNGTYKKYADNIALHLKKWERRTWRYIGSFLACQFSDSMDVESVV